MNGDAGTIYHQSFNVVVIPAGLSNSGRKIVFAATIGIWDALVVFLSGLLCASAYQAIGLNHEILQDYSSDFFTVVLRATLIGGLLAPLVLQQAPIYRFNSDVKPLIGKLALRIVVLLGILGIIGFLTRALVFVPRTWVIIWFAAIFVFVIGGRLLLSRFPLAGGSTRDRLNKNIAMAGDESVAGTRQHRAAAERGHGQSAVEQTDAGTAFKLSQSSPTGSGVSDLVAFSRRLSDFNMVFVFADEDASKLRQFIAQLHAHKIRFIAHGNVAASADAVFPDGSQAGMAGITPLDPPIIRAGLITKRLEDVTLAVLLILMLLPLLVIIAVAIKLDSPGPIYFRQRRHGLNNTEFDVLKFRTMTWRGSAAANGAQQTQRNDPRVTRVGRFLRRSSFDELPQLLNVLLGDMSLVGPRPHPVAMRTENRLCEEIVPDYASRHRLKPGLTGWAQINGYRGATSTYRQIAERVEHDLFYIENWSLLLDLKILALTPIRMILDSEGAF